MQSLCNTHLLQFEILYTKLQDELMLPSMQSEETKMASADEDTNDSDSDVPDQEVWCVLYLTER